MLAERESDSSERSLLRVKAISRWDNEGGAGDGEHGHPAAVELLADMLPLTNAQLVQLQIRAIALENLLAALLANASDQQLHLICIWPVR